MKVKFKFERFWINFNRDYCELMLGEDDMYSFVPLCMVNYSESEEIPKFEALEAIKAEFIRQINNLIDEHC